MTLRISEYLWGWSQAQGPETLERWSRGWDEEGGGGRGWGTQREWEAAGWTEDGGRVQQQDRLLLLGFDWDIQRSPTLWIPRPAQSVNMFDNSHYPFNCFNYDGDGYPSSSTDEEKKMCRPAYR